MKKEIGHLIVKEHQQYRNGIRVADNQEVSAFLDCMRERVIDLHVELRLWEEQGRHHKAIPQRNRGAHYQVQRERAVIPHLP